MRQKLALVASGWSLSGGIPISRDGGRTAHRWEVKRGSAERRKDNEDDD